MLTQPWKDKSHGGCTKTRQQSKANKSIKIGKHKAGHGACIYNHSLPQTKARGQLGFTSSKIYTNRPHAIYEKQTVLPSVCFYLVGLLQNSQGVVSFELKRPLQKEGWRRIRPGN